MADDPTPKRPRGFATLSPEERSRIARLGGLAVQAQGTAHRFTSEEGREAGLKGGMARVRKARANAKPEASETPSGPRGRAPHGFAKEKTPTP